MSNTYIQFEHVFINILKYLNKYFARGRKFLRLFCVVFYKFQKAVRILVGILPLNCDQISSISTNIINTRYTFVR